MEAILSSFVVNFICSFAILPLFRLSHSPSLHRQWIAYFWLRSEHFSIVFGWQKTEIRLIQFGALHTDNFEEIFNIDLHLSDQQTPPRTTKCKTNRQLAHKRKEDQIELGLVDFVCKFTVVRQLSPIHAQFNLEQTKFNFFSTERCMIR